MRRSWLALSASLSCAIGAVDASAAPGAAPQPVRIFAASSLTDALGEVARNWRSRGRPAPVLVFGGSALLARQVEAGAPADLYVTADPRWMRHLTERGRIEASSREALLGNALVLVAPRGRGFTLRMEPGEEFAKAFSGRLCMGEPDVVPAGTYARQALQSLGWWSGLTGRIVGTDDVRMALTFVERGECGAGIVYATDLSASAKVQPVARFPADTHAPIRYEFGLVTGARPGARDLLEALRSDATLRAVFQRHGFTLLGDTAGPAP